MILVAAASSLPAQEVGVIAVVNRSGDLTVRGTNGNDIISIRGCGEFFTVQVEPPLTVNGMASVSLGGVLRDVRVQTKNGDDVVRIEADPGCLSSDFTVIPRNLKINTGGGGDTVELSHADVSGTTSIVTGGLNDAVTVRDSAFGGRVTINGGGGDDQVNVVNSEFNDRVLLNGGGNLDDLGNAGNTFAVAPLIRGFEGDVTLVVPLQGPIQSSPIALTPNGAMLLNVNLDAGTLTTFGGLPSPSKLDEIDVGGEPTSVAAHPNNTTAYVSNSLDGTVSVVNLTTSSVTSTINVGAEPSAIAVTPNGSFLYVANFASNNVSVIDTGTLSTVTTVDLSSFGTAPGAIAVTNDGDTDDDDETVFVTLFFGQLRTGKSSVDEGQDDQREGRVVAISTATNTTLGAGPIVLGPLAVTGFNSNGRLAPATGQTPAIASTNPQTFTTSTGAFPNQLAAIALHPSLQRSYVVSTGASPNGPLRFNSNIQGLVSVFDTSSLTEVTADQTDASLRRTAPLNLNQGINLATTPTPRLFHSNPTAMAWRPDGSDAWVTIQNSNLVVRLTVDANGIPTVGAPLVAGPSSIVRVDLESVGTGDTAGKAPRGIVIDGAGRYAYVSSFISRSVTVIDLLSPTSPVISATAESSDQPPPDTVEATAQLGAELFFTGRGPQGRMSSESWGGCITCHPNGRSDNVTWMFDAGPRQTIPLDGMFSRSNPSDQRILNWSAVRDENHDFELNTRGVFGGRGLIDDDRLFLAIGGASGATPTDSPLIEQFHAVTGTVSTTNDLASDAALPSLSGFSERRDFGIATLDDDRVFIIGGRTGSSSGTLVSSTDAVLEFNPRTNVLGRRSGTGFTLRHSLGAAAVRTSGGTRIYAVGGYTSTDPVSSPAGTVEEYNPSTDTWRTVATLPIPVAQFGITVAGGINSAEPLQLIHVVSGNTGSESLPLLTNLTPVQRFQADPSGPGTWSTFTPTSLTLRRNHGAATALRGVSSRVFVIGGQDDGGAALSTVDEYTAEAVMTVGATHTSLPAPRARFGIGSSLSTNSIFVIGGVDDTGADQTTVLEYAIATNGSEPGPGGTPSGTWVTRGNLSAARSGLGVSSPPGVTNLLPARNTGRDLRQDAIAVWIAQAVRAARAPVASTDAAAIRGRTLFGQDGLVQPGSSCATCHGGAKWTRSIVDYTAPPSPNTGLGLGNERVVGAEIRQTASQSSVLNNVGTFTLSGGRTNELRFNAADISQAVNPLGANGFNIPSLLSAHETAPYFYNGLAQTLEEVLNGSQDSNGGTQHHFVSDAAQRADLVAFLRSIDDSTPIFP
jgi:YVTN family beta-propeller protein